MDVVPNENGLAHKTADSCISTPRYESLKFVDKRLIWVITLTSNVVLTNSVGSKSLLAESLARTRIGIL
jgi:hypothetical protein